MTYNDKLDADRQVTMEENIASMVFDAAAENDSVGESDAAELGRAILRMVLAEFRPDLFEGEGVNPMTRQEFFYYNAGSSHDPLTETLDEGRVRGAMQLAEAEVYAAKQGWIYEWAPDEPGHEEEPAEVCNLRGIDGIVLTSLCGICGATEDYRRVVEAELALQVMGWPAPAPRSPQEAAAAPVPRYTVNLHTIDLYKGEAVREFYKGDDETVMYSHVNAVEWTLAACHGTAEIEIVEHGRSRWIEYQEGVRPDFQEAE